MTDAVCPKCNGTTRRPVRDTERPYLPHIYGYRASDDTFPCDNCGGQTMNLHATGRTKIDPATSLGCMHEFRGEKRGNCYHVYTCTKCQLQYDIDSGD